MTVLTRDMMQRFTEEPCWTVRARIVESVATRYVENMFEDGERAAALDLFRLALYDAEPLVRRVLAETIKHASELPRDIVRSIVTDDPEVSAPFLAESPLLSDDDLIAIALLGSRAERAAIARRPRLPPQVARAVRGDGDQATPRGKTDARDASRSSGIPISPTGT